MKGIPASPGSAQGRVKVVRSPQKFSGVNRGKIIVLPFLAPEFVVLLKRYHKISGIVTELGGSTSHAAIVARELNIPYVAGIVSATKKLKDNTVVRLDGSEGIVYEIG